MFVKKGCTEGKHIRSFSSVQFTRTFPRSLKIRLIHRRNKYVILTYLLYGVEKLTGSQLVKKLSALYGTRRLITTFTKSSPPVPILSQIDLVYAFTSHFLKIHLRLSLPSGFLPSGFTTKTSYTPKLSPTRATCPVHPILLDLITRKIIYIYIYIVFQQIYFRKPLRKMRAGKS